jgi:multiple sugar transport system substrate-binding protein
MRLDRKLFLLAVPPLLLAACGGSSSSNNQPPSKQNVTITFANWASAEPATTPAMLKLISNFEAANPNIHVNNDPIAVSDLLHQVEIQCNAGDCPDVAEVQGNFIPTLASSQLLQPLDSYASGFTSGLYPQSVNVAKYQGKLDGIPWIEAPLALWYNRDLMKQAGLDPNPPQTLDELKRDLETVKQKVPNVVGLGLDTTNRDIGLDQEWSWMLAFGAEPIKNGKANANTPQMRNYLNWIRTLVKDGLTLPNKKYGEFRPIGAQGRLLFGYDGPYLKGVIQNLNPKIADAEFYATWGLAPTPSGPDGKHYDVSSGHQLAMFKASKQKDAAWKFMKFVTSSEAGISQYTIPAEQAIPPETSSIKTYPQLNNPITNAYVKDVIPHLVTPPYGPKYEQAVAAIMPQVQRAFATNDSVDSIAQTMQQQLVSVYGS